MARTKIEPVIYLKITLPNGIEKYCKTVSQAARFYADEMTRRSCGYVSGLHERV